MNKFIDPETELCQVINFAKGKTIKDITYYSIDECNGIEKVIFQFMDGTEIDKYIRANDKYNGIWVTKN